MSISKVSKSIQINNGKCCKNTAVNGLGTLRIDAFGVTLDYVLIDLKSGLQQCLARNCSKSREWIYLEFH